jgi:3-hydroxybutyryl-CoA dehydrogenase
VNESLAIVGSGAIACGLAATAAHHGPVVLLARSDESAERARATVQRTLQKLQAEVDPQHVSVVTDTQALSSTDFAVEAVVEHAGIKAGLLEELSNVLPQDSILATTTSSLSVEKLAHASGRPDRFAGLHVFNPVTKMQLVELVFPAAASESTRERVSALCQTLEKTAVTIPDIPGFVVNRLLFPYLFNAVALQEETGLPSADIDTCMKLGAGHPMGPLALLDLVGLDVSAAIGQEIGEPIPPRLQELISRGALGRKSSQGFHSYDPR